MQGQERRTRKELEQLVQALGLQVLSIRKICEQKWQYAVPCPLCRGVGRHAKNCYVLGNIGWDLLNEQEALIRENDELRLALARFLPAENRKAIEEGVRVRKKRMPKTLRQQRQKHIAALSNGHAPKAKRRGK